MTNTIPHLPEGTAKAAGIPDDIGQAVTVTLDQAEVLASALSDAIAYRTPEGFCADCEAHPAGLCLDHAADLDLTDAYLALARELGIEVER
jgi:hypothetical protein